MRKITSVAIIALSLSCVSAPSYALSMESLKNAILGTAKEEVQKEVTATAKETTKEIVKSVAKDQGIEGADKAVDVIANNTGEIVNGVEKAQELAAMPSDEATKVVTDAVAKSAEEKLTPVVTAKTKEVAKDATKMAVEGTKEAVKDASGAVKDLEPAAGEVPTK